MSSAADLKQKLQALKDRETKLTQQVADAEAKEKIEQAIAETRDAFSAAISEAIAAVEKSTGTSLAKHELGIWVGFVGGKTHISALKCGEDGLPAQLKRTAPRASGSGNGTVTKNEYVLKDGRVFATVLEALDALGVPEADRGQYWHRHDRLPKPLQAKITKREKSATVAEAAPVETETDTAPDESAADESAA